LFALTYILFSTVLESMREFTGLVLAAFWFPSPTSILFLCPKVPIFFPNADLPGSRKVLPLRSWKITPNFVTPLPFRRAFCFRRRVLFDDLIFPDSFLWLATRTSLRQESSDFPSFRSSRASACPMSTPFFYALPFPLFSFKSCDFPFSSSPGRPAELLC